MVPRILVTGGPNVGTAAFVNTLASERIPVGGTGIDLGRVGFVHGPLPELWLVGSPGDRQHWPVWNMLRPDLIGAVVLVDVRRLADCFGALDYLTHHRVPYVVGIHPSDQASRYPTEQVREALAVGPAVPVLRAAPRQRTQALGVLVCLVEYALGTAAGSNGATPTR